MSLVRSSSRLQLFSQLLQEMSFGWWRTPDGLWNPSCSASCTRTALIRATPSQALTQATLAHGKFCCSSSRFTPAGWRRGEGLRLLLLQVHEEGAQHEEEVIPLPKLELRVALQILQGETLAPEVCVTKVLNITSHLQRHKQHFLQRAALLYDIASLLHKPQILQGTFRHGWIVFPHTMQNDLLRQARDLHQGQHLALQGVQILHASFKTTDGVPSLAPSKVLQALRLFGSCEVLIDLFDYGVLLALVLRHTSRRKEGINVHACVCRGLEVEACQIRRDHVSDPARRPVINNEATPTAIWVAARFKLSETDSNSPPPTIFSHHSFLALYHLDNASL
mmetsp:Transcript_40201/g.106112  ORF Transcript_40201/g.106112 Transcript_40201/m.106112 type:complete len:336 (-) Transcript_40201:504-1511(-)